MNNKNISIDRMNYIQNRTNWCWAVACKVLGEQYKTIHPEFVFSIDRKNDDKLGNITKEEYRRGVATKELEGLRIECVREEDGLYFIDAWQRAIVMNANSTKIGADGNFSGDDAAKLRGLKYVVTGECNSRSIETVNVGVFDSEKSLLHDYYEYIIPAFEAKHYLIGNAVLYPRKICHSFILLAWLPEDKIIIYDPWDGEINAYPVEKVFYQGFPSALGSGVIKWVQYII